MVTDYHDHALMFNYTLSTALGSRAALPLVGCNPPARRYEGHASSSTTTPDQSFSKGRNT